MKIVKIVKSQNIDFWFWKVELWPILFKCDLNFEKINANSYSEVKISQYEQNGKKIKTFTFDLKKSKFNFDLNVKLPYYL